MVMVKNSVIPKLMIIYKLHTITQIDHILALTTTFKKKTGTYKDV